MAGNREGGLKAAATNKKRYGKNFYKKIGAAGGILGTGGGFAAMDRARVRELGRKGGKASKRTKND